MKEAKKKVQITEQICRQAQLMRKGGANQTQVAELLGINGCTVSRMEAAGFDFAAYTEQRKERQEKEKQRAQKVELVYDPSIAEEYRQEQKEKQLEGQMEMELAPAEEQKPEMSDQTKMMRLLAGQFDMTRKALADCTISLLTKLDRLNDTMNQILRAVRKE